MGGRPEVALSFIGFPNDKLPLSMLEEVMQGLRDACARASCAIVGGHKVVRDNLDTLYAAIDDGVASAVRYAEQLAPELR
jgi:selenide,water dikinase